MTAKTWEERAALKRASILAAIPAEWRLEKADLERAEKQRVLAGPFMEQLLDADTRSIVLKDSVPLVDAIKNRTYTSEQVTRAFCKSAAVAHQLVRHLPTPAPGDMTSLRKSHRRAKRYRTLASSSISPRRQSSGRRSWTSTSPSMAVRWDPCTACPSVSKTNSTSRESTRPWAT